MTAVMVAATVVIVAAVPFCLVRERKREEMRVCVCCECVFIYIDTTQHCVAF